MNCQELEENLDELLDLEAGWLNGHGKPISPDSVNLMRSYINRLDETILEEMMVAPSLDGGVILEHAAGRSRFTVEIDTDLTVTQMSLIEGEFGHADNVSLDQAFDLHRKFLSER